MPLTVILLWKAASDTLLLFRDKEISVHVFVINADLAKAVRAQNILTFSAFYAATAAKEKEVSSYKAHKIKFSMIAAFFLGFFPTVSAHQSVELTNANETK